MRLRPSCHRPSLVLVAASLSIAGCESPPSDSPRTAGVAVVAAPTPGVSRTFAPARATPVVPMAMPSAAPPDLRDMRPAKTFTDPPLPPELRDDGGLIPLPPPPAPTPIQTR